MEAKQATIEILNHLIKKGGVELKEDNVEFWYIKDKGALALDDTHGGEKVVISKEDLIPTIIPTEENHVKVNPNFLLDYLKTFKKPTGAMNIKAKEGSVINKIFRVKPIYTPVPKWLRDEDDCMKYWIKNVELIQWLEAFKAIDLTDAKSLSFSYVEGIVSSYSDKEDTGYSMYEVIIEVKF